MTGSRVTVIFLNGGFCLLVKLHGEGFAPAACAAALLIHSLNVSYSHNLVKISLRRRHSQTVKNFASSHKLDGVSPVDNRPSTNKLHHIVQKKKKKKKKEKGKSEK